MNEYEYAYKLPHRGLTSIEAADFLKKEFPQMPQWTCWTGGSFLHCLKYIVGKEFPLSGTVSNWSWKRVPNSYPVPAYYHASIDDCREDDEFDTLSIEHKKSQDKTPTRRGCQWVGVIEVQGDEGDQFMLFSFLNSKGDVGEAYFVSTQDNRLFKRFVRDVELHFKVPSPERVLIDVTGGPDVSIKAAGHEKLVLPEDMRTDIEQQTFSFFKNRDAYARMGLRHRRGFLFVGEPGTGKTMMVRHLIRQCHQQFSPSFFMLTIRKDTDEDDVGSIFSRAARNAPAMIILEDMDSLTTESKISRSAFLSLLDGVKDQEGVLVIGTTNHPGNIDPALVHRPSRFDRVWHFQLPDCGLRHGFLEFFFKTLPKDVVEKLARETKNWSFAYLKELHSTASIMAIEKDLACVTTEVVLKAFDRLDRQFQDGKKNHDVRSDEPTLGFAAVA